MKWFKFVLLGTALISSQAMSARWVLTYAKDEMRGTTEKIIQTESQRPVDLMPPYQGGSWLDMVLRSPRVELKEGDDPDNIELDKAILIISKGQFNCPSSDGCHINVKFDNEKIQKYKTLKPNNGSTDVIYLEKPKEFLDDIAKHKKLIIEADFFQSGARQFTFDLNGYSNPVLNPESE
ncbi:hypothetical protein I4B01_001134 [Enterobacter kobei]|uniref:hypothetical protein n=1 Tax=Enterobacter kobei TaxID=208224 RepID=UPI00069AA166|nr:hypothetical protein [Enterobacter kobei]EHN8791558.1 hypothetical protein [Enterobacter kobei]OUF20818.1 hypothetical protein AZ039_001493 [Enterobacter kobei]